jgi:hypothetical protein
MPRRLIAALIAASTLIATVVVTGEVASAQTGPIAGDGTTSGTAGASCWGIKQQNPSATDGVYWLNNAAMEAPERYYCDMTTDGGGWVLVGRGRNGWNFSTEGQGNRATVRDVVDGTGAFAPATLPSDEIDRLLNNQTVESLADGIRLRRATTTNGSTRQEFRLKPRPFGKWSWGLDGGIILNDIKVNGVSYGTSNTRDTYATWADVATGMTDQNNERRIRTTVQANKNYQGGFALGNKYAGTNTSIRGNSTSTSYLWEYTTEAYPLGFTQVFIRPKISNAQAGFTQLPEAGLPAVTQPFRLKNRAENAPWGVVGIDHTDEATAEPWQTNALSIQVVGDRVFVGGRFTGVQNGPGATPVAQPYLAAFDRNTGQWIDSFRPVLDGRVWDIQVAPDGNLYIGGDFLQVNGNADATALAKINPVTGAVVSGWKGDLARSGSTVRPLVRAIAVAPDGVYVGGNFNRLTGGTWNQISVGRAVKLNHTNGSPISAWKPVPSATVVDMDVTPAGSRVYLAGYFNSLKSDTTKGYFAAVNSTDGTPVPGQLPFQPSIGAVKTYQQAVMVDGAYVYVGGSEHNLQKYRMSDNALVGNHILRQGGDIQAFAKLNDSIFMACHCGDQLYSDTNNYTSTAGHSRLDPVNLAAQLDQNFRFQRNWLPPALKGAYGEGPWDFATTPDQCLFMAGDLTKSGGTNDAASWVGGFAKYCPDDSIAPSTPSNVTVTPSGTAATITFTPGTDASGSVQHWVYKNDRVIGTTWTNTFTDPTATTMARYTVRAVDDSRNKSATAPIVSFIPPAPVLGTYVAADGAGWSYLDTGVDPGPTWAAGAFDDSSWSTGTAPLGWNDPVTTQIGAAKPIVSYFRKDFVANKSGLGSLRLKVRRDDGAAVYLNGVELARTNLPGGALANDTLATEYISGAPETQFFEFSVPASLLNDGDNTIAVRLHQASAQNGDADFDLSLEGLGVVGDAAAPSAPSVTAVGGPGSVSLNWTASNDTNLIGYEILRDAQTVAFVGAPATAYTDAGLAFSESHQYRVRAVDGDGNSATSNPVSATTQPNTALMSYGSQWKWRYEDAAPAAEWNTDGFDDSTWNTGAAEFGYGENDEATVMSTNPTPRPLIGYFRTTVNIPDPGAFAQVTLDAIRDDGIVVYVNGVEVGRNNIAAGTVTGTTPAVQALSVRAEELAPVTMSIPSSAFRAGSNTIAVSVHNSDRWSGDLSFNMKLTGVI